MGQLCERSLGADSLKGHVTVKYRDPLTREILDEVEFDNLVVGQARNVIRDSLFSNSAGDELSAIVLGDNGFSFGDTLPEIPQAAISDTELVRQFFFKTAASRTVGTLQGRPSITLNFVIGASEANDSPRSARLITELGLNTTGGRLYSRLVRTLFKSPDTDLLIAWTVTF